MTTLAYDSITITFGDDLLWVDEYAWMAVSQRREYTVMGSMIVDSAVRQAGRTITLAGGPSHGWVTRGVLDQLAVAAAIPGQQFTLTLRGTAYTVVFDHVAQALEAEPVFDVSDPSSTDFYVITLRFVKV